MWNPMSARRTDVFMAVSIVVLAQLFPGPSSGESVAQEASTPEPGAERPSYEVARTKAPIQVDGRLDEAAWQAAETFAFFHNRDGSPAPPELATVAKALYDDTYIYFAFDSTDPNAWSTRNERDLHLWEEEEVEGVEEEEEEARELIT